MRWAGCSNLYTDMCNLGKLHPVIGSFEQAGSDSITPYSKTGCSCQYTDLSRLKPDCSKLPITGWRVSDIITPGLMRARVGNFGLRRRMKVAVSAPLIP